MVNQLTSLVRSQAAKYGNREVFSHKDYSKNQWVPTSWNRFSEQVSDIAKAIKSSILSTKPRFGFCS